MYDYNILTESIRKVNVLNTYQCVRSLIRASRLNDTLGSVNENTINIKNIIIIYALIKHFLTNASLVNNAMIHTLRDTLR